MNKKLLDAIKFHFLNDSEKKRMLDLLPAITVGQLLEYSNELSLIIPRNISIKDRNRLINVLKNNAESEDIKWESFIKNCKKEMSLLNHFPEKLNNALLELS